MFHNRTAQYIDSDSSQLCSLSFYNSSLGQNYMKECTIKLRVTFQKPIEKILKINSLIYKILRPLHENGLTSGVPALS